MTLVTAWIRKNPGSEELVVASDSRLTGGISLNHAPKLFPLQRSDAVLAYCGPTLVAYPILLQIKASLDAHEETRNRVVDIVHLKSHIEKTIERLRAKIDDLPSGDQTHQLFKFLLAGYSWKTGRFRVWVFRYNIKTGAFNAYSLSPNEQFVFMSDVRENEKRAKDSLVRKLQDKEKFLRKRLEWEPLEVLFDIINDPSVNDIGGPPQIYKIYRHSNILPVNAIWREESSLCSLKYIRHRINHLGRPLLGYERTSYLTLDPNTWKFIEPWNIRDHVKKYNDIEKASLKNKMIRTVAQRIAAIHHRKSIQALISLMIAKKRPWSEIEPIVNGAHDSLVQNR